MNWWQKHVAWILAFSMLIFAVLCVFYITVSQAKVNQTLNEFIRQSDNPLEYNNEDIPPAGRFVQLSLTSTKMPSIIPFAATETDAQPDDSQKAENPREPEKPHRVEQDIEQAINRESELETDSELLYGIYQALLAIFALLALSLGGVCVYMIIRPFRFLWR